MRRPSKPARPCGIRLGDVTFRGCRAVPADDRALHPGAPRPTGAEQHDHDPGDRRHRHARPASSPNGCAATDTRCGCSAGDSEPYAVDLREGGSGLDAALAGVDTVVHCATTQRGGDERSAANLIAAARRAYATHLVYISIVGVDRVPLGYYRSKYAVEKLVAESGIGWTVLRATQFHDLVVQMLRALAKLPVVVLPAHASDQPVEVAEVADRLAELAQGAPAGRVPDMGGPEVRTFASLARAYLGATGRRMGRGERAARGEDLPRVPRGRASRARTRGRRGHVRGVPGGAVRPQGGRAAARMS